MAKLISIRNFIITRFLLLLGAIMLAESKPVNGQVDQDIYQKSIAVLKQASQNGETFFIKVHAAENLIRHGQTEGLETEFLRLKEVSPNNLIGANRVLARLNKHQPKRYKQYIDALLSHFKNGADRKTQLTALESLGKLGYKNSLPLIKAAADTGTNGFKGMARWILSNSGLDADENRLSELLLSEEEVDYRYAAYALRFKPKTNNLTVIRLTQCLQTLKSDDPARVYVASSLFVHIKSAGKERVKTVLLTYLTGEVGQRYEVAEALGLGGSQTDLPVLQKLLNDVNTDVQVAAANAVIRIMDHEE